LSAHRGGGRGARDGGGGALAGNGNPRSRRRGAEAPRERSMTRSTLPATTLGKTGREVTRVAFGCYRVDDRVPPHREALEHALRTGVTLIDTSTNYGDGHAEILVGKT